VSPASGHQSSCPLFWDCLWAVVAANRGYTVAPGLAELRRSPRDRDRHHQPAPTICRVASCARWRLNSYPPCCVQAWRISSAELVINLPLSLRGCDQSRLIIPSMPRLAGPSKGLSATWVAGGSASRCVASDGSGRVAISLTTSLGEGAAGMTGFSFRECGAQPVSGRRRGPS